MRFGLRETIVSAWPSDADFAVFLGDIADNNLVFIRIYGFSEALNIVYMSLVIMISTTDLPIIISKRRLFATFGPDYYSYVTGKRILLHF